MKEKEEDEERNENICPQTHNQAKSNSITEATLILCGSSGERANREHTENSKTEATLIHCGSWGGAGQYTLCETLEEALLRVLGSGLLNMCNINKPEGGASSKSENIEMKASPASPVLCIY